VRVAAGLPAAAQELTRSGPHRHREHRRLASRFRLPAGTAPEPAERSNRRPRTTRNTQTDLKPVWLCALCVSV